MIGTNKPSKIQAPNETENLATQSLVTRKWNRNRKLQFLTAAIRSTELSDQKSASERICRSVTVGLTRDLAEQVHTDHSTNARKQTDCWSNTCSIDMFPNWIDHETSSGFPVTHFVLFDGASVGNEDDFFTSLSSTIERSKPLERRGRATGDGSHSNDAMDREQV